MASSQIPPSYANGFAPRDGRVDDAGLCRPLQGLYSPWLGPTGQTLHDIHGRSRNGAMVASPDWGVSERGWHLNLNGTTQYVDVPPGYPGTGNANLSMFGWYRTSDLAPDQRAIWGGTRGPNTNAIFLWMDGGGLGKGWAVSITGASAAIGVDITSVIVDTWQHVGFTMKAATTAGLTLYVDGQPIGTANSPASLATISTLWFGRFDTQYARLDIGEVGIWDRPLNVAEVRTLHQDQFALTRLARRQVVSAPAGGYDKLLMRSNLGNNLYDGTLA